MKLLNWYGQLFKQYYPIFLLRIERLHHERGGGGSSQILDRIIGEGGLKYMDGPILALFSHVWEPILSRFSRVWEITLARLSGS